MNDIELIIAFIGVGIAIITAIATLIKTFTKSTVDLNTTLIRLTDKIDMLFNDNMRQDARLDNHGLRLENLEHTVTEQGVRLEQICDAHSRIHWDRREE